MIRLHIVVEGQTEETFVNRVLSYHLGQYNISVDARQVETSRKHARIYRGGFDRSRGYQRARRDLALWMQEDQNADAYFTTMFDFSGCRYNIQGVTRAYFVDFSTAAAHWLSRSHK
jgi:hypothetical protein